VFSGDNNATVYYLAGTLGWSTTFGGLPTAPWWLPVPYNYTTNNGSVNITGYTGSGDVMTIPSTIIGLPVTSIGTNSFNNCTNLTNVTIPNSVTSIGDYAFSHCTSLTNVIIGNNVTSIGDYAFSYCTSLTNVIIGNSVTSIGDYAFYYCTFLPSVTIPNCVTSIGDSAFDTCGRLSSITIGNSVTSIGDHAFAGCAFAGRGLTSVTIPGSVTHIGDYAFWYCTKLTGVYFQGNAPSLGISASYTFYGDPATIYYLPGTTGWSSTFGGRPTALWFLPNPMVLNFEPNFGVHTNCFGFTISWATNIPVVVEACTNLANRIWFPVGTNTLTAGTSYFSDPQWTNYPGRFYRLRSP
jgi:hypothetical protein